MSQSAAKQLVGKGSLTWENLTFKMNSDLIIYLPRVEHVVVIHFFFFPIKEIHLVVCSFKPSGTCCFHGSLLTLLHLAFYHLFGPVFMESLPQEDLDVCIWLILKTSFCVVHTISWRKSFFFCLKIRVIISRVVTAFSSTGLGSSSITGDYEETLVCEERTGQIGLFGVIFKLMS